MYRGRREHVDPLNKQAKWMRELPQDYKYKRIEWGDKKIIMPLEDVNQEVTTYDKGRAYKRVRLFSETQLVLPNVSPNYFRRWGYLDMRGFSEFMIYLQNKGSNWINYTIESTLNPDTTLEKGSDDYGNDPKRKGWFILREMQTLSYSYSDSSYINNPQNLTIFPSAEFRYGTKSGSPNNTFADEYGNARIPWAFVRVGIRMNSGTGARVICYGACRT